MTENKKPEGLALLREPFPANQISVMNRAGVKLSYVGHAALTDRLLDADPAWNWEPLARDAGGLPLFDKTGGLWIKLTVCGQTRLGYGNAAEKKVPGDREKEVIGDALRNAAMRFGAALDLWHKGDLHDDDADAETPEPSAPQKPAQKSAAKPKTEVLAFEDTPDAAAAIEAAKTPADLELVGRRIAVSPFLDEERKSFQAPYKAKMAALRGAS